LTCKDKTWRARKAFAAGVEAPGQGNEVSISGFGKFKVKETAACEGRNPATREVIKTTVGKAWFRAGQAVKNRLNGWARPHGQQAAGDRP
jgi:nucleoid DNA-binding protein